MHARWCLHVRNVQRKLVQEVKVTLFPDLDVLRPGFLQRPPPPPPSPPLLSLFLLHPSRVRVGGRGKEESMHSVENFKRSHCVMAFQKCASHKNHGNERTVYFWQDVGKAIVAIFMVVYCTIFSLSLSSPSPPTTHPCIPVPTPPPPMPLSRARGLGCTCACSAGCWCCSCVGVQQDSHQHTDCLPCILDVSSSWWRNPSAARVNVSPWACGPPWPPSSYSTF